MLKLQNENEFRRIAYAFMSVFSNIEAVTLSSDGANKSIDLWKSNDITCYYGVYSYRRPRYEQVRGGLVTRNRNHLISDCLVKTDFPVNISPDKHYYMERSNIFFPFKFSSYRKYEFLGETKRHLECIANLMKLKKINIGYNNKYTFTDDENTIYSMNFRGANGNIHYKGDISY